MAEITVETIRQCVLFAHGNFDGLKEIINQHPRLVHVGFQWRQDDVETPIMAAAHVGHRPIAKFLLERGAALEIWTAAMLGDVEMVGWMLQAAPERINAIGAHGFSLLYHATLSGKIALLNLLKENGLAQVESMALHAAIGANSPAALEWLLKAGADDLAVKNYQDKTPLARAQEADQQALVDLLVQHGAEA